MSEKQGVILVVDDEEMVRNLLQRTLQEAGLPPIMIPFLTSLPQSK